MNISQCRYTCQIPRVITIKHGASLEEYTETNIYLYKYKCIYDYTFINRYMYLSQRRYTCWSPHMITIKHGVSLEVYAETLIARTSTPLLHSYA